jgi:polar amino acid transport system permease protein
MEWSWSAFFSYLASPDVLRGVWTTTWLTAVSMTLGVAIGLCAAVLCRLNNRIITGLYVAYVTLLRGTPLLVQLYFMYSGLPKLGVRLDVAEAAILALSLNEGAYLAEVMRSGIDAISKGQLEAAKALGMTYPQVMRHVILPQAFRAIAPVIGNQVNALLKSTSLVSVISMEELFRSTEELRQASFRTLECFAVALFYYLLLTTTWSLIQGQLERRLDVPKGRSERPRQARLVLPEGA